MFQVHEKTIIIKIRGETILLPMGSIPFYSEWVGNTHEENANSAKHRI